MIDLNGPLVPIKARAALSKWDLLIDANFRASRFLIAVETNRIKLSSLARVSDLSNNVVEREAKSNQFKSPSSRTGIRKAARLVLVCAVLDDFNHRRELRAATPKDTIYRRVLAIANGGSGI